MELTEAFIARAKRFSRLNAYITLDEEGALRAARYAEAELARGAGRGPLHGLPVAVKDQFDAKGLRTTVGGNIVNYIAEEDATAVGRLREAGAVLLGKLNLSEYALGGNVQHPFGVPRNPWDETRQAGQSSSGSGVAIAASLCAASLGGDTAGSIRGPAGWCGIVGLRPTWGVVSRHGAFPMAWFMDTIGPMTKTVADAAMLYQTIAGHDPRDPYTSRRPVTPFEPLADLRGIRVGVVRESIDNGMATAEVADAVGAAMHVLPGGRCIDRRRLATPVRQGRAHREYVVRRRGCAHASQMAARTASRLRFRDAQASDGGEPRARDRVHQAHAVPHAHAPARHA